MLALSEHFKTRWQERVGTDASVDRVQQIMQDGVIVQRARCLMKQDGHPFQVLGIYWDPEANVIITVDEFKGMAVSVLVPRSEMRKK